MPRLTGMQTVVDCCVFSLCSFASLESKHGEALCTIQYELEGGWVVSRKDRRKGSKFRRSLAPKTVTNRAPPNPEHARSCTARKA